MKLQFLNNGVHDPLEENPQTSQAFALAGAKLYWDEIYFRFIENPYNIASKWLADRLDWDFWHNFVHENVIFGSFHTAAHGLSTNVDRQGIDKGILLVAAQGVNFISGKLRRVQTGFVRTYALTVVFGTVLILVIILLPVIRELLGL